MATEAIELFFVLIVLLGVSYYIKNWALLIVSGISFIFLMYYDVFTLVPTGFEQSFKIMAAIVIIFQGIVYLMDEKKKRDD